MRFEGLYCDGHTAETHPVTVLVDGSAGLHAIGRTVEVRASLSEVAASERLGGTRRFLALPGGATIETDDNDAVDAIGASLGAARGAGIHALERSWPVALAALVVTVVCIWAGLTHGVPAAAEQIASRIPPEVEAAMGEETLAALDARYLEPTELEAADQDRVRALYGELTGTDDVALLELRHAPELGANAFALPSGRIVVTDELVHLAHGDDELAAVLAHELGHVHYRHIMRSVLQSSATALLVATLVGDVGSVAGLITGVPTFLMEARYSRRFELEADRFAAKLLAERGRDPRALHQILRRLTEEHGSSDDEGLLRYLSTHPATEERIDALESGQP